MGKVQVININGRQLLCKLRYSTRAKNYVLRVLVDGTIEFVSPKGAPKKDIHELIEQKQEWLLRSIARVHSTVSPFVEGEEFVFSLYGGQASYTLSCTKSEVQQWLKRKAQKELSPILAMFSEQYALTYAGVSYRLQRGRWGSCSAKKRISLNSFLLFLPKHLIHYVMLHELAHTRFFHHQASFWDFLCSLDSEALVHKREMRLAWSYVPLGLV